MGRVSKYRRWHNQIIQRSRKRDIIEPYDKHHVVPRSLGGTNEKSNIVKLTHREHFLIHWLLVKMHKGENRRKMWFALSRMRGTYGRKLTSWQYDLARKSQRQAMLGNQYLKGRVYSQEELEKRGAPNKGRKFTEDHRRKISLRMMGNQHLKGHIHSMETRKKLATNKGKKFTKEHRRKISLALMGNKSNTGRKMSDETRKKISDWHRGRTLSEATRRKIALTKIGKKASPETRAKMRLAHARRIDT